MRIKNLHPDAETEDYPDSPNTPEGDKRHSIERNSICSDEKHKRTSTDVESPKRRSLHRENATTEDSRGGPPEKSKESVMERNRGT